MVVYIALFDSLTATNIHVCLLLPFQHDDPAMPQICWLPYLVVVFVAESRKSPTGLESYCEGLLERSFRGYQVLLNMSSTSGCKGPEVGLWGLIDNF